MYHCDCAHNEKMGLNRRHMFNTTVDHRNPMWKAFCAQMDRFGDWFQKRKPKHLTREEFLENYDGAMRRRYERAADEYEISGYTARQAQVGSFIKQERVKWDGVKFPDPRMIQARRPMYNFLLGSYLRPIEKELAHYRIHGLRATLKGLDLRGRAAVVVQHIERLGDCRVYKVDSRRFDGHINASVLRQEHKVYKYCYKDPMLRTLLNAQLHTKARTKHGISYTTSARCSGDPNTSLGNHLIVMGLVEASCRRQFKHDRRWSYVDDGDDVLIFVHNKLRFDEDDLKDQFETVGQDVECLLEENVWNLDFCRQKLFKTKEGWTFVRDPRRVLASALTIYKHFEIQMDYYSAIAMSLSYTARGVPILEEFASKVLSLTGHTTKKFNRRDVDYYAPPGKSAGTLGYTPEALAQFLVMWDIDITTYHSLLEAIDSFDFTTIPMVI